LVDVRDSNWLIDPAVYWGHREVDLAMMQLFGGFGASTYEAYDEVFPLAAGWRERVEWYQLPPLLVHAILFGGSYGPAALAVLRRYA
jgi:fructosamine-3-kinase